MRKARKKLLRLDTKANTYAQLRNDEDDERDEREAKRRKPRYSQAADEVFKCQHCRRFICPPASGGRHRNHCPFCLHSRHVDERKPGDRLSSCGTLMAPVGHFQRPNGEYVIIHRCNGCAFERFNRIAADDDFERVLALPAEAPRSHHDIKTQELEAALAEHAQPWTWDSEAVG